MAIELTVPSSGESIAEVYIGTWRKAPGDFVDEGEILVELETDKATLELPAPASGTISELMADEGDSVAVGSVIALIEAGTPASAETAGEDGTAAADGAVVEDGDAPGHVMPAAARLIEQHGLQEDAIQPTGPGQRLLKEDVQRHLEEKQPTPTATDEPGTSGQPDRREEKRPFTPIRKQIAKRLVEAQHNAALLTTFNEVDMTEVIALRRTHQEAFQQKHGTKLGFMSFFVKAAVAALKAFPQVNAYVQDGDNGLEMVYHHYCDIGIAVGGGKGLVVPVLRNAEHMSFAEIETSIADLARRAQENKLALDELQGGTFTISNGGVYGSLLSTPIVNPPQSGILGLHAIQDRPVVRDGQVVVAKMMYLALTYDHRIVDGREAVTFLATMKQSIEQPARMLLDV